jgi:hypothetical protein
MDEMVIVSNKYGRNVLEYGLGKAYLKNQSNGRCVFQRPLIEPIYKTGENARVQLGDKAYYLYMDPDCKGVILGQPSERFRTAIVPEIVRIGMGLPVKQKYTTSKSIHWKPI